MLRRALVLAAISMACAPASAAAQDRSCDLVESGRIDRNQFTGITTFHDPFYFRCTDGTELRASRGVLNQISRELVLNGNVFFRDPDRELTANDATYNSAIGRLYATGDVVFTNRLEGSTIRGPELEYFRPLPDRPQAQVIARQRPHLVVRPREADAEAEPLELDADQVTISGEDQLDAVGSVVVTRSDLRATSQEARYSESQGVLDLRRGARIRSDRFTLAGETIHARLLEGSIEYVRSREEAELTGEDLTVRAPEVQLFFADSVLQRAVARTLEGTDPAGRPVAISDNFRLEADSLEAVLPGQELEQVVAIGRARGEATDTVPPALLQPTADTAATAPDSSARPALALVDRDWIVGDTVIGYFAPRDSAAAPGDTAVVLERLVARGNAQSLYRVAREGAPAGSPRSVNFLSGDTIRITLQGGELSLAEVTGLRRGLYLDPVPPGGGTGAPGNVPDPRPTPQARPAPRGER